MFRIVIRKGITTWHGIPHCTVLMFRIVIRKGITTKSETEPPPL